MISARIMAKNFGARPVLRDVALTVAPGECLAVMGPSGVGKSTLLRILAGLDPDFTGEVTCPDEKAILFQEPTLLPWRSAAQNIALFHPALNAQAVADWLARVGLAGRGDAYPGQLSLGQQRRLALARACAGTPRAIFLDEPFVSLDPAMAHDMVELTAGLLADLRAAVVFVTHSAEEAARLGTKRLVIAPQDDP